MHIAHVESWGSHPKCVEVPVPETPADFIKVKLVATGIHRVVRSRASGRHQSSRGRPLPHVPGIDGVGTDPNGNLVYFLTFTTGGSFAEYINVPKEWVFPLPEGVDPILAAALVNPVLSSWMALTARCNDLKSGFSMAILGATSASGRMSIQLAKSMGAGKIIGIARNELKLSEIDLDERIILQDPADKTDFSPAADVDVILDYVYGPPAEQLLMAVKGRKPVQYVHIGSLGGLEIRLPGSVIRDKDITIRGSAAGSWSFADAHKEMPGLLEAMKSFKATEVEVFKLTDVEKAWGEQARRVVIVP
jgi:NADPH:quinone reductase-like Zn-dependent oxidoreductase